MLKRKKPLVRLFICILICFTALLAVSCPEADSESNSVANTEEPEQPPALAALFNTISLATPFKAYNHGNPITTQNFGADPYAIVYDERVYIYMTGDTPSYNQQGQPLRNTYDDITTIRVVSSSDLVNWQEHPAIKVARGEGAASWAQRSWAPAFAYKEINGQVKFFLYFANGAGGIGVLSADSPVGPFNDPLGRQLISSATPNTSGIVWLFDPAVLVDDDGTGYLYFGGGTPDNGKSADTFESRHPDPQNIRVAKLGADMISLDNNPVLLDAPFSFEDSGINKIGNTYYYSYCSNPQVAHYATRPDEFPEAAHIGKSLSIVYMTSDNPMTGFTLGNMIMDNPGPMLNIKGGNNHHCMFEFRGRWYMAYHSRLLADAMGLDAPELSAAGLSGDGEGYRVTSIDSVTINNGVINEVRATREGPPRAGTLNPYYLTDAATIAVMAGITTKETPNRMVVTGVSSGSWIAVKGVAFGSAGASRLKCHVTPPAVGKVVIQIRQGGLSGNNMMRAGYVEIPAGSPAELSVDLLTTITGTHDIVFVFAAEGGDEAEGFEFIQWQFLN